MDWAKGAAKDFGNGGKRSGREACKADMVLDELSAGAVFRSTLLGDFQALWSVAPELCRSRAASADLCPVCIERLGARGADSITLRPSLAQSIQRVCTTSLLGTN